MSDRGKVKKWIAILDDGTTAFLYGDNIQIALINNPLSSAEPIREIRREDWRGGYTGEDSTKEQRTETVHLNNEALQNLEWLESMIPCDNMCGCDWCAEHCVWGDGAKKECWEHYLLDKGTNEEEEES